MLRSILVIVAGFLIIGALSIGTDAALVAAHILPPRGHPVTDLPLLLLVTGYVAVYAILGCYVTAALAPSKPMLHALILGVLGLAFNLANVPAMRALYPAWFVVLSVALVLPYAWIGGRLAETKLTRTRQQEMATS